MNSGYADVSQLGTLQALVERLTRYGDAPAIIVVEPRTVTTLSFADLVGRAHLVATELRANGVELGEPIGIAAPNGPAWVATCLGILASGAAAMPLDVKQSSAEREASIGSSGCRILYRAQADDNDAAGLVLERIAAAGAREFATRIDAAPGSMALLLHTSATTGAAKAVPLTHANVMANLRALVAERLVDRDVRALLPLPLHHVYPLVVGLLLPLCVGGAVVFPANISGSELARALDIGRVNTLVGVPRLYESLCEAIAVRVRARGRLATWIFDRALAVSITGVRRQRYAVGRRLLAGVRRAVAPTLHRLACGGAALDVRTLETLLGLGYEVLVGYGLTETAPLVAFNRPYRIRVGSVGEVLPGVEVRIAEPGVDSLGEIEVRGPNLFAGYLGDDAATAAAFRPDGWFRTGDCGRLDAERYLYVHGRLGETLVLPGGEKLDPESVEAEYAKSPAIGEIAVLLDGGKLVALVVPTAHGDVRGALRARGNDLPRHMQLAGFAMCAEPLPRTPIGKLQRYRLPALYRTARARSNARAPVPQTYSAADRALLADPETVRMWAWLRKRFPQVPLSLESSPQLDLGVDSLGWISLTLELERDLGIRLDEAELEQVTTLRDLIQAVRLAVPVSSAAALQSGTLATPARWEQALWLVGQTLNRMLMRGCFGLRAEGQDHLPQCGPYVICPNHASYLDPPALAAALPTTFLDRVVWAGAVDTMFANPRRALFSRLARVLPIDPVRGARAGLALTARALRQGKIVIWFPEGWRTTDGLLRPFLPGIGELVLRTNVPIIPAHISGTFAAWPAGQRFPRPHRIVVRFGPALTPVQWEAQLGRPEVAAHIAAAVKAAIAALADADAGRAHPSQEFQNNLS